MPKKKPLSWDGRCTRRRVHRVVCRTFHELKILRQKPTIRFEPKLKEGF